VSVTLAKFRVDFPEFANTADAIIEARIAMAIRQVNSTIYGGKTDDAIEWLTADMVACGPLGEQARLSKDSKTTIYREQYEAIKQQVAYGFRVI